MKRIFLFLMLMPFLAIGQKTVVQLQTQNNSQIKNKGTSQLRSFNMYDSIIRSYLNLTNLGTGVQTALGVNIGSAGAPVINGGDAGTPSALNFKNASQVKNKIFYVDDYGAVGDSNGTTGNGTDNTTTITNCLAAMESNGGGIMQFGFGDYRFTSKISITNSNIIIRGLGIGITSLYYDPATTADNKAINLSGTNVGMEGISMFSNNSNSVSYTSALLGTTGAQITIENCEFYHGNYQGIVLLGGTQITFTKNLVHDNPKGGVRVSPPISESITAAYVSVINNKIWNIGDDGIGISFNSWAHHITATNNILWNIGGCGVAVYGHASVTDAILVANNNISTTFLSGILIRPDVGSLKNVHVVGNELTDCGQWTPPITQNVGAVGLAGGITIDLYSGSSSYYVDDVFIIGNHIKNPRNNFISIGQGSNVVGKVGNITIKDNSCNLLATKGGAGAPALGTGNSQTPTTGQYAAININAPTRTSSNASIEISDNKITDVVREFVRIETTTIGGVILKNNTGNLGNSDNASIYGYDLGSNTGITLEAWGNTYASNYNAFLAVLNTNATTVTGVRHLRPFFSNSNTTSNIATFNDNETTVWSIVDGGALTAAEGSNIAVGTSTGSIIATSTSQKLGFFAATPVVQPTATTDLGTVLSNLGLRASGTAFPISTTANITAGSLINRYTSTATAAGTTTLTVSSNYYQAFTGSTTQTVTLPVVTTMVNGQGFRITNASSGTVTVQTSGSNSIKAMAANSTLDVWVINTGGGTGTASWNWLYTASLNN